MKVSGFTILRNAVKFNYPFVASIKSILPICDEFIVNVGKSEDDTLAVVRAINDPKIRIVETEWDMSQGSAVLSQQTNIALHACRGDWAFYLQSDEVIHEDDLPRLKACMARYLEDASVDALRFKWLHFYGSFWRYRIDHGWYQKQDRIIRNNGQIESFGDAFAFRRKDGKPLLQQPTNCLLYHYGWVNTVDAMKARCDNAAKIGYQDEGKSKAIASGYGDLDRFPAYLGTHPIVMQTIIDNHALSRDDWQDICRRQWWNPLRWLRVRFKSFHRVKERIN